jgi:hypothetical protein
MPYQQTLHGIKSSLPPETIPPKISGDRAELTNRQPCRKTRR